MPEYFSAAVSYVFLDQVSVSGSGTIQVKDVKFYISEGTNASAYIGIYTDNGSGAPSSLIASTKQSYNVSQWNTASFPFLYLTAGQNYWLAFSATGGVAADPGAATGSSDGYGPFTSVLPVTLEPTPQAVEPYTMGIQLEYCQ